MDILPINKIVNYMRDYQKENNIIGRCITNSQYLYDCLIHSFKNKNINIKCEVKCVYITFFKNGKLIIASDHLVLLLNDDEIIDPSYAIYKLRPKYYLTYKNFNEYVSFRRGLPIIKKEQQNLLNRHIEFTKYADNINNTNYKIPVITDKDYYNKQADYIQKCFQGNI